MRRLALTAVPLFALTAPFTPSLAADLDGPVYRERDVVIERPAPPVVRERIIERNYYYEASRLPPSVPMRRPTTPMPPPIMATRLRVYGYDDGYRWPHRRAFFVDRAYRWHHHHWRY